MWRRFFLLSVMVLALTTLAVGQDNDNETSKFAEVPEVVLRDVIRRVLIFQFKPVATKKTVMLANQIYMRQPRSSTFAVTIDPSWLPKIRNVEFQLLNAPQDEDVFFFKEWEGAMPNTFLILFGHGNPECTYSGNLWVFRVGKYKSKLWLSGGAGAGCANDVDTAELASN
ncbi:MAG TPA: hypothetical protein PKC65_01370 [Pyrinomonadaceae bacterium]|nr:hypothetical protein [Pyrinomonadaceae bacterium]